MNVASGTKTVPYNINPIWKPMRAACKVDSGIVLGYSAVHVEIYAYHNVVEESFYVRGGGRAGWYILQPCLNMLWGKVSLICTACRTCAQGYGSLEAIEPLTCQIHTYTQHRRSRLAIC